MKLQQEVLEVATSGRGFVDVTPKVAGVVGKAGIHAGLCSVYLHHTSAGLLVSENADPSVLRDLDRWLAHLAPEGRDWEHDAEGPDDMPGHAKSLLTRTSESIPICDGKLALGTWQALYLCEFRSAPHRRKLTVTVIGS